MIARDPLDHVPKAGASVAYTTTRAPGEIFIQLAVRAGRDTRLKLATKGLLYELLTYHDGELPADEDIYEAHRAARTEAGLTNPDGKQVIHGALAELEQFGYLVRVHVRDANGHRRVIRMLTDSPGHHKFDAQQAYERAQESPRKTDRLCAERELLTQRPFPRPAHCPPADTLGVTGDNVISLEKRRLDRAG